jgi:hypothetical protein
MLKVNNLIVSNESLCSFNLSQVLFETKKSIRFLQGIISKKGSVLIVNSSTFSVSSQKSGVFVLDSKSIAKGHFTNSNKRVPNLIILLGKNPGFTKECFTFCIPTILIDKNCFSKHSNDYIVPFNISSKNSFLLLSGLFGGLFEHKPSCL